MSASLTRLRQKIRDRGVSLGPTVSADALGDFKGEHRVALPESYKAFLQCVGNGGEGPYLSTLLYFPDPLRAIPPYTGRVQFDPKGIELPFPFTQPWCWEADAKSPEGTEPETRHGNLCLAEAGCGIEWHLILSGAETGNIWYFCDAGICPTVPRRDFLAWYEAALDGERWHPDTSLP